MVLMICYYTHECINEHNVKLNENSISLNRKRFIVGKFGDDFLNYYDYSLRGGGGGHKWENGSPF